jgi:hypothetical protein
VVLAAVACAGALVTVGLVLAATRDGLLYAPDGTAYVAMARNVADGEGITLPYVNVHDATSPAEGASVVGHVPVTHYPPATAAALALGSPFGVDPDDWAPWLNALCDATTVALGALAAARLTRRRRPSVQVGAVVATVGVLAGSQQLLVASMSPSSEPLYLPSLLGALLLADRALDQPPEPDALHRWSAVGAGALTAVAALTRYVGVALVVVLVLGARTSRRGSVRARAALASGWALAALPALAWALRPTPGGSRGLGWHPPGRDQWDLAMQTLGRATASHLAPSSQQAGARVGRVGQGARRGSRPRGRPRPRQAARRSPLRRARALRRPAG